ncbi:polyprenyl synthetase family protein [Coralloluteibacterium stylophorae]|uniref:Polyprenyl synthetase family protein n=1 Tax=Coralloluteibacterium stylophorae TaxID=1776034 RepID=A0A8J7VVG8_9GAMM|nr:farnesyl diphosphate synthase [Coralloluteibacterium stylophorae]MBS7456333.1 polyprenyl synthetase family protein [Coralloluteibacterium stylophorae]
MPPEPRFDAWRVRTESGLEALLGASGTVPERLLAAMRHASLGGGKRLRPLLVYAAGTFAGADEALLDAPAVAVELVHAYSLVHDDLPAMDDDALRRGRPTVHVAYDEATAILAGDALQTLAFETLARAPLPAATVVALVRSLADASGAAGMCGGQALDIEATGSPQPLAALERMHGAKTGALIRAAVRMGALAAEADIETLARLDRYAAALGLAFQIRDDILDVEGDAAALGKTAGKDAAQAKSTYPALLGLDGARAHLQAQWRSMQALLAADGERAGALLALGRLAVERDR